MSLSMISAARDYVARMVTDVAGMKVLIMDQETTGIVSMVYTKTQILQVSPRARHARDRVGVGRTGRAAHSSMADAR